MKKIVFLTLLIIGVILAVAFKPNDVSIVLTGTVYAEDAPLKSVRITIEDKTDYYEFSNIKGDYKLQYNAPLGSPKYIKYSKEGYTTVRQSYREVGHEREIKKLPPVTLLKLTDIHQEHSSDAPFIKVYNQPNLTDFDLVQLSSIDYFNLIEPFKIEERNESSNWYQVNFQQIENTKPKVAWLYQ